jgi:HlyD family secretion protein
MASHRLARIVVFGLLLVTAGLGGYLFWRLVPESQIVGVVRATEVRVAPEVGGQLTSIKVQKGAQVRAADVVAELSADELTAAVAQARAALTAASANRDHVYAGVRDEQIAGLAAEIAKAKSRLQYAELQLNRTAYLTRSDTASQQALDQAKNDTASAQADVAEAAANHAAAVAGPTKEERLIADAQVKASAAALAVLERQLDKTFLRAPADGIVSVIVAEIGENVRAGEPILVIEETGKQWLSFNLQEDQLHGLTVGTSVDVARAGTVDLTPAVITELVPLGTFATWQAERAIGDHDRNSLRLRLDPRGNPIGFEPGMTVWIVRPEMGIGAMHSASVGLGEPATTVVGSAIGNVIVGTVGARVRHLPVRSAAVLEALTYRPKAGSRN